MENNNRRDFLKTSILGISGASLLPVAAHASNGPLSVFDKAAPLPTRVLGRTGIETPLISLGAGGTSSASFVKAAYDAGIKLFFSATYYGEGNNEKIVGEGLKGLPRETFVVGTAVPPEGFDHKTGNFSGEFDPEAYIRKAEGSLQRFGLDYVDFFLFPYAGKKAVVQHEGVIKALEALKKKGKTKFIGIATHSDVEEALISAADAKVYDVAMPAFNYKVQDKKKMEEALAYATKAGMGIVAMKTTAGAFRDKNGPGLNTDAALKWVLQNKNITCIVSGMSNTDQLQKNLTMLQNLKLSEQELKELNLVAMHEEPSLYCQQCKTCLPQCTKNLDIPTIMRSYMYAYGYRNMEQAYYTLANSQLKDNPCDDCEACNVKCASGFDVKAKICDISRLQNVPRDFLYA
jgi:predicted aldo/keto reductase-like oxidoreductase